MKRRKNKNIRNKTNTVVVNSRLATMFELAFDLEPGSIKHVGILNINGVNRKFNKVEELNYIDFKHVGDRAEDFTYDIYVNGELAVKNIIILDNYVSSNGHYGVRKEKTNKVEFSKYGEFVLTLMKMGVAKQLINGEIEYFYNPKLRDEDVAYMEDCFSNNDFEPTIVSYGYLSLITLIGIKDKEGNTICDHLLISNGTTRYVFNKEIYNGLKVSKKEISLINGVFKVFDVSDNLITKSFREEMGLRG